VLLTEKKQKKHRHATSAPNAWKMKKMLAEKNSPDADHPHFLYNTLTSIRAVVKAKKELSDGS